MEPQQIGRYDILAELGRGAMGVVYKAADPVLDRIVAVKTVNLSLDPDARDEYEARFLQEAKAVGSLSHPSIVTVYDLGKTGNLAYLAMEFLDGRELRDLISEVQRLPVKQAIAIATQVASGLGYAHRQGIVHRDIKPANIMVLKDGVAKITDFGIARIRISEVKTQTGMRLGSPKYMSPEQVLGQRVDYRTDIFSLGIVLYEMLTGKAPFGGDSLEALMYQTVNTVPLPPSRINPDVPTMLDLILAKMLEKRPENRYQDAESLAGDLHECEKRGDVLPSKKPAAATDIQEPSQLVTDPVSWTIIHSRRDDVAEDNTGSLSLSPVVDSFAATQRLVKEIGMGREFNGHLAMLGLASETVTETASRQSITVPLAAISPHSAGSKNGIQVAGASSGNRRENLIAVTILAAALVAAGLIAFV